MGSKVKANFGSQCIRPCGQDKDYSLCQITFKLRMIVVGDEGSNPNLILDHGVKSQGQLWHFV